MVLQFFAPHGGALVNSHRGSQPHAIPAALGVVAALRRQGPQGQRTDEAGAVAHEELADEVLGTVLARCGGRIHSFQGKLWRNYRKLWENMKTYGFLMGK